MLHQTLELWEPGMYKSGAENFRPTLATYILAGEKKRGAVIICPGGGYSRTSPREAEAVALQFNAAGYHAFVVFYSVAPRRHPQPLMDLSRALCIVRHHADEWQIDPEKIAVCGFSAGGHLAASLGVFWDALYLRDHPGITIGLNRPNALILGYPVITGGKYAHKSSFQNLLGENADPEMYDILSLERQVHGNMPPVFLWHTVADQSVPVENSLLFAQALREHGISFELHIYPAGAHGLSLANAETAREGMPPLPHVAGWMGLCLEWLGEKFQN